MVIGHKWTQFWKILIELPMWKDTNISEHNKRQVKCLVPSWLYTLLKYLLCPPPPHGLTCLLSQGLLYHFKLQYARGTMKAEICSITYSFCIYHLCGNISTKIIGRSAHFLLMSQSANLFHFELSSAIIHSCIYSQKQFKTYKSCSIFTVHSFCL